MNNNQISDTLSWLRGFSNRIDENDDFSQNAMLYYRKLKSGKYIVVNHFNRNRKVELQGFDSWLCEYVSGEEPGIGSPISIESIKLGIKLPQDKNLIEHLEKNS